MTDKQLKMAAALDIRYWFYVYHKGCPNCGMDFTHAHPMYNLYPHFTGACKEKKAA